jgi:hypothetical protein
MDRLEFDAMQQANCRRSTPCNLGPAARYRGLLFFGVASCNSFYCFKAPAEAGQKTNGAVGVEF